MAGSQPSMGSLAECGRARITAKDRKPHTSLFRFSQG
jgi:hypothetical protein